MSLVQKETERGQDASISAVRSYLRYLGMARIELEDLEQEEDEENKRVRTFNLLKKEREEAEEDALEVF